MACLKDPLKSRHSTPGWVPLWGSLLNQVKPFVGGGTQVTEQADYWPLYIGDFQRRPNRSEPFAFPLRNFRVPDWAPRDVWSGFADIQIISEILFWKAWLSDPRGSRRWVPSELGYCKGCTNGIRKPYYTYFPGNQTHVPPHVHPYHPPKKALSSTV